MTAKALGRRVARVANRIDPAPDAKVLAYARAMVAWAGEDPDEAAAVCFAKALAKTRGGATWAGLVELAGDEGDDGDCPPSEPTPTPAGRTAIDLHCLTPLQMERAAELRERFEQVGYDGLTDEERADAEHLEAILLASDPLDRTET